MLRRMLAATLAVAAYQILPVSADDGQTAFNTSCRTCHTTNEGDHRQGPSLHGIFGKAAGSQEGYPNYSASLKQSGVTWDEETLDKFIENPDAVVSGNAMKPYGGITDAEQRKLIVAFLKEQG
jgi:cytochrome c